MHAAGLDRGLRQPRQTRPIQAMKKLVILFIAAVLPGLAADDTPHFRKEQIRQTEQVASIAVVDLNDDGRPDILASGDLPVWFQNPAWTKRPISDVAGSAVRPVGASKIGWIHSIRHLATLENGALV